MFSENQNNNDFSFRFCAGSKGADIFLAFSPGWTPGTPQVFTTCIYQTLLPSGQQHAPTTQLQSICRAISDSKRAFPVGLVETAVSGALLTKVTFTRRLAGTQKLQALELDIKEL